MPPLLKKSQERNNIHIVGYGGTIMSSLEGGIIIPKRENVNKLLRGLNPETIDEFNQFRIDTSEPFIDSSNATVKDIMTIVADVRQRLADPDVHRLILLYGTDSMEYLMAALGLGISKKELNGKSVVVTCAMTHLEKMNTDAIPNFLSAVQVSSQKEIRGRIGLLFAKRFFPAMGLEKVQISKDFAFVSRFRRMAKKEGDEWNFDRPAQAFDSVLGIQNQEFELISGVQPYYVTPMTNYASIAQQIQRNTATILVGLGDGNLRSDEESIGYLQSAANKAKGPVVVVGGAAYNAEESIDIPRRKKDSERYEGNGAHIDGLISGGVMTQSEATVFVSSIIAKANKSGKKTKDQIEQLIRFSIFNYPFFDLQSSVARR